jgi:hypothetical protein
MNTYVTEPKVHQQLPIGCCILAVFIGLVAGGGAMQCVALVVVVCDGGFGRWSVGGESTDCD